MSDIDLGLAGKDLRKALNRALGEASFAPPDAPSYLDRLLAKLAEHGLEVFALSQICDATTVTIEVSRQDSNVIFHALNYAATDPGVKHSAQDEYRRVRNLVEEAQHAV